MEQRKPRKYSRMLLAREIRGWVLVAAALLMAYWFKGSQDTNNQIQARILEMKERQDQRHQKQADAHDARVAANAATLGQVDGAAQDLKASQEDNVKAAKENAQAAKDIRRASEGFSKAVRTLVPRLDKLGRTLDQRRDE